MTLKLHPLNSLRKLTGFGCASLFVSLGLCLSIPHPQAHTYLLPILQIAYYIDGKYYMLYNFLVQSGWKEMIISPRSVLHIRCDHFYV